MKDALPWTKREPIPGTGARSGASAAERAWLVRRTGRPRSVDLTTAEVAQLLEVPERLIRARARFSFFANSVEDKSMPGGWRIPRRSVEFALRSALQPLYTIQTAARLLDVGYSTLFRQTAVVSSLRDPIPDGRRLRALLLFLGTGRPMKRIPESELARLIGGPCSA